MNDKEFKSNMKLAALSGVGGVIVGVTIAMLVGIFFLPWMVGLILGVE